MTFIHLSFSALVLNLPSKGPKYVMIAAAMIISPNNDRLSSASFALVLIHLSFSDPIDDIS